MKKSNLFKISSCICVLFSLLCCVIVLMCSQISYADNTLADEPTGEYTVVDVAYPDGVTLHADPENTENVKTYQWFSDFMGEELNGTSATTEALVFPSTHKEYNNLGFSCKITYKDDSVVWKKVAQINVTNYSENLDVAYVSEYALLDDGAQINFADVGLGSGFIKRYNKQHFELNNVNFNNYQKIISTTRITFHSALTLNNTPLLNYWVKDADITNIQIDIVGKNDIFNSPIELEGEKDGQPILDFFGQNYNFFDLNIVGGPNSSFNAKGGNCFITSNSNIVIDNLIFNAESLPNNRLDSGAGCVFMSNSDAPQFEDINGITIKDSQLNFKVYGASIWSGKNIEVKNSSIISTNQYAFDDIRYSNYVINSAWMFEASNSNFDIKVNELYSTDSVDGICAVSSKFKSVWDSCDVNINLQAPAAKVTVYDVKGINCSSGTVKPYPGIEECLSVTNSNLNIKIGDANSKVISAHALKVNSSSPTIRLNNSNINCDVASVEEAQAIFSLADIYVLNSQLNLNVEGEDTLDREVTCAIGSSGGKVNIDLNNPQDKIAVNVLVPNNVIACGIGAKLTSQKNLNSSLAEDLGDTVIINGAIKLPEYLTLGQYLTESTGHGIYYQTIFDKNDLEHPALNFTIGAVNPFIPQEQIQESQNTNADSSAATFDNTSALISMLIIALIFSILCCNMAIKRKKHYL